MMNNKFLIEPALLLNDRYITAGAAIAQPAEKQDISQTKSRRDDRCITVCKRSAAYGEQGISQMIENLTKKYGKGWSDSKLLHYTRDTCILTLGASGGQRKGH